MRLTHYVIKEYLRRYPAIGGTKDTPVIKGQAVNMARIVFELHQRVQDLEEELGLD